MYGYPENFESNILRTFGTTGKLWLQNLESKIDLGDDFPEPRSPVSFEAYLSTGLAMTL